LEVDTVIERLGLVCAVAFDLCRLDEESCDACCVWEDSLVARGAVTVIFNRLDWDCLAVGVGRIGKGPLGSWLPLEPLSVLSWTGFVIDVECVLLMWGALPRDPDVLLSWTVVVTVPSWTGFVVSVLSWTVVVTVPSWTVFLVSVLSWTGFVVSVLS